jgi:chaperone BCS1
LDSALLRPGRIDKKVQYNLATREQASALYLRFFRDARKTPPDLPNNINNNTNTDTEKSSLSPSPTTPSSPTPSLPPIPTDFPALSTSFAAQIPQHAFSTAELQGYLLGYKQDPVGAVDNVVEWVEHEMRERREKGEREERRRNRAKERRYGAGGGGGVGPGAGAGAGMGMQVGGGVVNGVAPGAGIVIGMGGAGLVLPVSPSSASGDVNENGVGVGVVEEQLGTGLKLVVTDDLDQASKSDTESGSDGLSTLRSPF